MFVVLRLARWLLYSLSKTCETRILVSVVRLKTFEKGQREREKREPIHTRSTRVGVAALAALTVLHFPLDIARFHLPVVTSASSCCIHSGPQSHTYPREARDLRRVVRVATVCRCSHWLWIYSDSCCSLCNAVLFATLVTTHTHTRDISLSSTHGITNSGNTVYR
jgi:hypothetical protein